MKKQMKFRVVFWRNDPEKMSVMDEANTDGRYFIGLDGYLYENYGTKENPVWEFCFDSDYEIELTEERKVITIPVSSNKKWWQFWKEDDLYAALKIAELVRNSKIHQEQEDYYISVKNQNL